MKKIIIILAVAFAFAGFVEAKKSKSVSGWINVGEARNAKRIKVKKGKKLTLAQSPQPVTNAPQPVTNTPQAITPTPTMTPTPSIL